MTLNEFRHINNESEIIREESVLEYIWKGKTKKKKICSVVRYCKKIPHYIKKRENPPFSPIKIIRNIDNHVYR